MTHEFQMNRDMDLIRKILFTVENTESDPRGWIDLKIENYNEKQISYHVMLLNEAGLIEGEDLCTCGPEGFEWKAKRLTWYGHDFLDAARDDTVWNKAKGKAGTLGSVSFDIMKELLVTLAKEKLGIAA